MSIERFCVSGCGNHNCDPLLIEDDGEYVYYSDYEMLVAQNDANRYEREVVCANYDRLKAENELLRHQLSACAKELRKASSWICREVEAGTSSATHWAIRLRTNADQIDAAISSPENPS